MGFREKLANFIYPARAAMAWADSVDRRDLGWRRYTADQNFLRYEFNDAARYQSQRVAYLAYYTSPLVRRIINDTKNFILGEGVSYQIIGDDPDGAALKIIDDFWYDSLNRIDIKLESWIETLFLVGEQCYPVIINPVSGKVTISYLDPMIVQSVTALANFPEIPDTLTLSGTIINGSESLQIIRKQTEQKIKEYGKLTGNCFWFAVNKPPNQVRGSSDLVSLFGMIERFETELVNELDRAKMLHSYIWDVTMEGATVKELEEYIEKNKTVQVGSIRAHNERVKWVAESPSLNQADNRTLFEMIRSYISAGVNRPDSWFGSGGKAYQTEAELMGEPSFKSLKSKQRYVKYMLEYMLQFVIDQAVIAKTLPDKDLRVSVIMPEMQKSNITQTAAALQQITNTLVLAKNSGLISQETAQKQFAEFAETVTGMEFDEMDQDVENEDYPEIKQKEKENAGSD